MSSAIDYLQFSGLFSEEDNEKRLKIREFMLKEVQPTISEYIEKA